MVSNRSSSNTILYVSYNNHGFSINEMMFETGCLCYNFVYCNQTLILVPMHKIANTFHCLPVICFSWFAETDMPQRMDDKRRL